MDGADQEMTLAQYMEQLPKMHRAYQEYCQLRVRSDNLKFYHEEVFPELPDWDAATTPPLTYLENLIERFTTLRAQNEAQAAEIEGLVEDVKAREFALLCIKGCETIIGATHIAREELSKSAALNPATDPLPAEDENASDEE